MWPQRRNVRESRSDRRDIGTELWCRTNWAGLATLPTEGIKEDTQHALLQQILCLDAQGFGDSIQCI